MRLICGNIFHFRVWSNTWLLSFECSTHVLVVMQKSMEKLCWMNKFLSTDTRKRSIYVKVGRNNVHFIKVLKLWVILWSIFRCNVNGEFMFDEQWMKKISQDLTLDFFWFLSKKFFSKIWAAKFRVQFIWGCGLSAGFYGTHVFIHIFQMSLKMLSRRQLFSAK